MFISGIVLVIAVLYFISMHNEIERLKNEIDDMEYTIEKIHGVSYYELKSRLDSSESYYEE
jgi:uncharacterized membrane protein